MNDDAEAKIAEYTAKIEVLEKKQQEIERLHKSQVEQLEAISGLSAEEAKNQLVESLKAEAKTSAMSFIQDTVEEAKMTAHQEAKKVIISTIQRVGTEEAVENCVSVFNIESDDVKGRIIGREGRNIRALEAATGVEIIVDDTPEAIILSCFDPVRREIARLALHKLVTDGRIHPARIEEVVAKTAKQIDEEIIETGKRTVIDLGIHGLHPELIKVVGRMKYRSSYGQNLLQHSREVAKLCGIMAAELGLNVKLAKRAGLLHDIGKVHRWSSTVNEQYVPHVKPQENGGHMGVRWFTLTNQTSHGLYVQLDQPRMVTVTPMRSADLADATHNVFVQPCGNTVVSIDAVQRGVGTASCGPDTLPKYKVKAGIHKLSWTVITF